MKLFFVNPMFGRKYFRIKHQFFSRSLKSNNSSFISYVKAPGQIYSKVIYRAVYSYVFIALVILLIQFLWKYIEDLVGKGLGTFVIAKLLFYASANMIPLALPLATLLSSIMVYGNLGERFELAALKSAGISMFRFMRSTIIAGIFIAFGAFMFSNYVLPKASLKFWTTLIDITKQKPALNIKPDQFYNEIDNYSILIGSKQEDNIHISDITIYEEGDNKHNTNVLIAAKGEMLPSGDKKSGIEIRKRKTVRRVKTGGA